MLTKMLIYQIPLVCVCDVLIRILFKVLKMLTFQVIKHLAKPVACSPEGATVGLFVGM